MFRRGLHTVSYVVLIVIAALALSQAGPLDPPGPPAPTMKTLDEIPPTWSLILPTAQRFVVVMDGGAVLDKETGLVWERSPSTVTRDWTDAMERCPRVTVANRYGWRLPTVEELASLKHLDQSSPFDFDCSDGNCIQLDLSQPGFLWTSTAAASDPNSAWIVRLNINPPQPALKTQVFSMLCVRGGPPTQVGF
jgi:hypothetical protein